MSWSHVKTVFGYVLRLLLGGYGTGGYAKTGTDSWTCTSLRCFSKLYIKSLKSRTCIEVGVESNIYLYDTIGTLSNLTGTCPCYSTANTTQSAMYPCWISGCKSLQPKAWFPTRRRSSFDPQVGGSNYSCFQLYLEWWSQWSQFMVYCSLYITYMFFGMGWNHQQLNGMAWHGDGMQSTKTTHGIGHLASAHWQTTSLSLFISPASATPCRTTLQHFGRNKHK